MAGIKPEIATNAGRGTVTAFNMWYVGGACSIRESAIGVMRGRGDEATAVLGATTFGALLPAAYTDNWKIS
jgi:hypothetical protein